MPTPYDYLKALAELLGPVKKPEIPLSEKNILKEIKQNKKDLKKELKKELNKHLRINIIIAFIFTLFGYFLGILHPIH